MSDFNIEYTDLGQDVALIKVNGYIDAHTFEDLENEIQNRFSNRQFKIIVDLSNVPYISSAGAGVFIGAFPQAQENDGNIVLLNPSKNVLDVLDLLGLTEIFTVTKDLEAAKQAF
ncbi:MAG: STAS domain-containing protein [Planctomycetes bacterium]|nr:STAS domain-containing protein [Planctomycetota bacterium]